MPLSDKDFQLIEKSHLGQLTPDEQVLFNKKLKEPAFEQEVNLFLTSIALIESAEDARLKAILQREEKQVSTTKIVPLSKQKARLKDYRNWWKIAASIALLGTICLWLFWPSPSTSDYLTYLKPIENTLIEVERSGPSADLLQQAFYAYEQKNYQKALPYFSDYLQNERNDNILFYQANTFIGLNQSAKAIPLFKQILTNQKSVYLKDTEWLLALSYLKNNQPKLAKELLTNIKNSAPNPYSKQAEMVLNTI